MFNPYLIYLKSKELQLELIVGKDYRILKSPEIRAKEDRLSSIVLGTKSSAASEEHGFLDLRNFFPLSPLWESSNYLNLYRISGGIWRIDIADKTLAVPNLPKDARLPYLHFSLLDENPRIFSTNGQLYKHGQYYTYSLGSKSGEPPQLTLGIKRR